MTLQRDAPSPTARQVIFIELKRGRLREERRDQLRRYLERAHESRLLRRHLEEGSGIRGVLAIVEAGGWESDGPRVEVRILDAARAARVPVERRADMEIIACHPSLLDDLAEAYNQAIQGVPHCYPASARHFGRALAGTMGDEGHPGLRAEAVLVAREGGAVLGFIHTGIRLPRKPDEVEHGVIRFFCHQRGRRAVGQALLEAAEDGLRGDGQRQVEAFHYNYRYRFYHLDHAYLSDRIDHVHALMGFNGYERLTSEVFLDWPGFRPPAPAPAGVEARIALDWRPGRGRRPGLVVRALQGAQEIGICETVSAGEFTDHPEAQDWCFTEWLGVVEEFRGRGLGRCLLQHALQALYAIGYRHAAISTNGVNFRAALFYSNFGYRVSDWTHVLRKGMD